MPSRVIMRSVNMNTPRNAAPPALVEEASSLPSMSRFI